MNNLKLILIACLFIVFGAIQAQEFNPPFFVFEDGLWNARSDSPEYWSDLVKEVGFDGLELIGLDRVDKMLPELKRNDLELFTLYIKIEIDNDEPYPKFPAVNDNAVAWRYCRLFVRAEKTGILRIPRNR